MSVGHVLVALAALAAAAAIALRRRHELAARAHVALVLAALAWLVGDLLLGTLHHRYAWAHSRPDLPFAYRLAGLWGGEEGTVLLWNAVVAVSLLLVREPLPRRLLLGLSGALALLNVLLGTFRLTSAQDLALAPFGRGLADVLMTPLMVIHPPIQFVAYGLLAVPAAYALASLWAPPHDGAWAGRAFPWARVAWLFATLGIGLGALWAYYVLSFGGYWAWDPVETSNLLPWLALTAFLHAGKLRMRGQGAHVAAPALAYGAFLLTLFATFATRSGLWVSVHAFTDPTDRFEPDAAARLLAILDAHLPSRAFLALLTFALLAGAGLWSARRVGGAYGRAHGALLLALAGAALLAPRDLWSLAFSAAHAVGSVGIGMGALFALLVALPLVVSYAREEGRGGMKLDDRTLLASSFVLLAVALGVTFLLDLQIVNGPEREAFDRRAPFVAAPIVSAMTLMLARAPLGTRAALALAGAGLAGGLAAAALVPSSRVLALALPLCGAAAVAAVLRIAHAQGASAPRGLRVAGALLLVSSLLALVLWSNPPTYAFGRTLSDDASLALGLAGLALALLGLVGAVAAFRARGRGLAVAGALAAALAVGYGVGALLALVALALVLRARGAFAPGLPEGARLREAGIHLIHLAVALGLLGYAASTYAGQRETFAAVGFDAQLHVGEHALALARPQVRAQDGVLDALWVDVEIAEGGRSLGRESLAFEWRPGSGVYEGRLDVRRALDADIYLRPLAFHTPEGWVGADSAAGARVPTGGVDAVTFSASILPLMSLVWAGAWMMVMGMGLVLVGSALARRR